MTIAADILQIACPMCTRLMKDHPGMIADIIVIPIAYISRHTHRAYLTGVCEHAQEIRGPYESLRIAESAWRNRVEELTAQKAKQRAELEATLQRIHAKSQTVLDRDAASANGVGKETGEISRDEHQQLFDSPVDDGETKLADQRGESGAASVGSGMCQKGNQIYPNHDLSLNGECKRCGFRINTTARPRTAPDESSERP